MRLNFGAAIGRRMAAHSRSNQNPALVKRL
jgi:hypothetical protein